MWTIPKMTFDDFDEIIVPDRSFFKILFLALLVSILIALVLPSADQPIWPRNPHRSN